MEFGIGSFPSCMCTQPQESTHVIKQKHVYYYEINQPEPPDKFDYLQQCLQLENQEAFELRNIPRTQSKEMKLANHKTLARGRDAYEICPVVLHHCGSTC